MTNKLWNTLSFECGAIGVVTQDKAIVRVCFESSVAEVNAYIGGHYPDAQNSSSLLLKNALQQLTEYFAGTRTVFNLSLNNFGFSSFVLNVYQALVKIPYGSIVTYGQLAAMAGSPMAARATGRAMATNPFPIIVPCHRVVNANGRTGFYSAASGAKTKQWLLDFEGQCSRIQMD